MNDNPTNTVYVFAIDLGKSTFHTCAQNAQGKVLKRHKLTAAKLKETLAQLPACIVVMEACASAHYWAHVAQQHGHKARLISPQFVKPFVKSNKNDQVDAEAIAEAATRPTMRFVPIKSKEQQTLQAIHRARRLAVSQRTSQGNQIRGFLLEFGITIPVGISSLKRNIPLILEDADNALTTVLRQLIYDLWEHWKALDKQVNQLQHQLEQLTQQSEPCKRLMTIPGIGPLTATALLASIGNPTAFKNGRELAAYLGLVPRQHSTGGKQTLLGISKRGDRYLRTLLIHGARAALRFTSRKTDKLSQWATALNDRRGNNITAVALANKNVRIAWCLLTRDETYKTA